MTATGPYAYAIRPTINADGTIDIPIAITRESVAEWYGIVRGHSAILPTAWPIVEVYGEWFTFQQRITLAKEKATGVVHENDTILLLPMTSGSGITGELTWFRAPREDARPAVVTDRAERRNRSTRGSSRWSCTTATSARSVTPTWRVSSRCSTRARNRGSATTWTTREP